MASKFNNYDIVTWRGSKEVYTVQEVRPHADGETRYLIQLGTDAAKREWAKESELELITAASTQGSPGFYPGRSIME